LLLNEVKQGVNCGEHLSMKEIIRKVLLSTGSVVAGIGQKSSVYPFVITYRINKIFDVNYRNRNYGAHMHSNRLRTKDILLTRIVS